MQKLSLVRRSTRALRAGALVMALAGLSSCGSEPTSPRDDVPLRIEGRVTAKNGGTPIVGATVTLQGAFLFQQTQFASTQTGPDGRYQLNTELSCKLNQELNGERSIAPIYLLAEAVAYGLVSYLNFGPRLRCVTEVQKVDFALLPGP